MRGPRAHAQLGRDVGASDDRQVRVPRIRDGPLIGRKSKGACDRLFDVASLYALEFPKPAPKPRHRQRADVLTDRNSIIQLSAISGDLRDVVCTDYHLVDAPGRVSSGERDANDDLRLLSLILRKNNPWPRVSRVAVPVLCAPTVTLGDIDPVYFQPPWATPFSNHGPLVPEASAHPRQIRSLQARGVHPTSG